MKPHILGVWALLLTAPMASAQYIYTVAGTGTQGYSGTGGQAIRTGIVPLYLAVDASGAIYFAQTPLSIVGKVAPGGKVTTYAGTGYGGYGGYGGDGGAATSAMLNQPGGLAVDSSGNLYIADSFNHRVRKVTSAGVISTVAGTGTAGYSGDGGAATSAMLNCPSTVALDSSGNLYIGNYGNGVVRKVNTSGIISTVAGNGGADCPSNGATATGTAFGAVSGIAVDSSNHIYVADGPCHTVWKVTQGGTVSLFAGTPSTYGYSGDGGPATSAMLFYPSSAAVDASGNVYIVDASNRRIRKVTSAGIISTVAGNGTMALSGDGGAATSAALYSPLDVALDSTGNLYITDNYCVIRAVALGTANPLPDYVTKTSVFRAGLWVKDYNANGVWDGTSTDRAVYLGQSGDVPVVGDWNGDGRAKIGIFRNGMWVLDYNGNGVWDGPGTDRLIYLGQTGDTPVVGDWNGSGTAKVGVFRAGLWVLDYNGNGTWDGTGTDKAIYLGQTGDTPVVGDWNGGGTAKVGVFRAGLWVLDYNGNGVWDGTGTDRAYYLGQSGDTPVVGYWNNSGTAKAGIFRAGLWVLDYNGNGAWDGSDSDKAIYLGQSGDIPVVGDWTGNGKSKVGVFRSGLWVLDYDGSGTWDGTAVDRAIYLGQAGDTAVAGNW